MLTLLAATAEVSEKAACPIITMSMAGNGIVSRLCGEVFGSAVTFGAGKKASAPGQIGVEELRKILTVLHGGDEIKNKKTGERTGRKASSVHRSL